MAAYCAFSGFNAGHERGASSRKKIVAAALEANRLFKEAIQTGAVSFEPQEVSRSNQALLAWKLRKLPSEIRQAPAQDIWDLLGVMEDEAARAQS